MHVQHAAPWGFTSRPSRPSPHTEQARTAPRTDVARKRAQKPAVRFALACTFAMQPAQGPCATASCDGMAFHPRTPEHDLACSNASGYACRPSALLPGCRLATTCRRPRTAAPRRAPRKSCARPSYLPLEVLQKRYRKVRTT